MTSPVDITHQFVIVARLGDVCRFSGAVSRYESDPWFYMRTKLREIEAPLQALKQQQLASARGRFLKELAAGTPSDAALADFRAVLDRYLGPGDYADVAIHLDPRDLALPSSRALLTDALNQAKPHNLFQDPKPHERLIAELWSRLGLDRLEAALTRKPKTARRKAMVLRRLRRNVAEYCSVLHVPTHAEDTFSPFMLHRVEALAVACLRLLDRCR
ncbi:MAG: hypothetical protein HY553_21870 [Elusimicrobia bacterium]|nr:hypothetical protein [Elusimicrobiota bacterium]